MRKDPYPTIFATLSTCEAGAFGNAFSELTERLLADFLPPHDREGLLELALAIVALRRNDVPPDARAKFADAVARFFARESPAVQMRSLLALHAEAHLSAACQVLMRLILREL